jgi:hypothetical protein
MQRLTQGGVIEPQIASQRVDGRGRARRNPGDGVLHFVNQGRHILDVTGMSHGQVQCKDKTRRRLSDHARLAAKLGRAMAVALANGGHGGIIGIDDLVLGQCRALGQSPRLVFDPVMGVERRRQLGAQTRPLVRRHVRRAVQVVLGGLRQGQDWRAHLQQAGLGLAHQRDQHVPHAPALAAEAAHPLPEVLLEVLRLRLQRRALSGALLGDGRDDLEDFFWA